MKQVVLILMTTLLLVCFTGCPGPGSPSTTDYREGDTGPGNGIVFYDDTIGFDFDNDGVIQSDEKDLLDGTNDGTVSGDRYLEASPTDWPDSEAKAWGIDDVNTSVTDLLGSTPDELSGSVGNGEPNTAIIIAAIESATETDTAAQWCVSYSGGTLTDWFLPSIGELLLLYENKVIVGNFNTSQMTTEYYSSSECSDHFSVWSVYFYNGSITTTARTFSDGHVRPVRAF